MYGEENFSTALECTVHLLVMCARKSGNIRLPMDIMEYTQLIVKCATQQMAWRLQDFPWLVLTAVLFMTLSSNQKTQLWITILDFQGLQKGTFEEERITKA